MSDYNNEGNFDDNIINTIENNNQDTYLIENTNEDLEKANENNLNSEASNEIYISTDGDDLSGDGTAEKPYKTIQQGIEKSNNESTIFLSEGIFDGLNFTIDKTLTIEGKANETIAKLTLIGLILINGNIESNDAGYGGSIINDGGELTLINCTIKDSYSSTNGGAIFNNNGKLTIKNSNFINNSAVQYGGGIYSSGITVIDNSFFTENHITAEKGVGGAIACGGIAEISNSLFLKNYAIYNKQLPFYKPNHKLYWRSNQQSQLYDNKQQPIQWRKIPILCSCPSCTSKRTACCN